MMTTFKSIAKTPPPAIPAAAKRASTRVALVCQECGKRFSVSSREADPECPKCGGVDWEVA